MKKSIIILAALFTAASLSAQEKEHITAIDNWFVQGGAGINTVFNDKDFGKVQPAAEIFVGKRLTPNVWLRAGVHGLYNRHNPSERDWNTGDGRFTFLNYDADVMLDAFNLIGGCREDRLYSLVPYARFSGITTSLDGSSKPKNHELGIGASLHNSFRVGDRFSVYADLSAVASREQGWRRGGRLIGFPSATVGITFRLGRQGFRRPVREVVREITVEKPVEVVRTVHDTTVCYVVKAPAGKPAYMEPVTVYFDLAGATLSDSETTKLARYASSFLSGGEDVILSGAADRGTGTPAKNLELSRRRAEAVKDVLVRRFGIDASRITVVAEGGVGDADGDPALNRRVTVAVRQ